MTIQKKDKFICILFGFLFAAGFLLCVFMPKNKYSESERRQLAVMPELSADALWSGRFMSDFETWAVDHFPFREQFRTGKALVSAGVFFKGDNNGLYVTDGYIASLEYPIHEASLDRAVERFQSVCNTYLTEKNRVYLSVIPDKNRYLAAESGHPSIDYTEFERQITEKATFASYIPISDLLEKEDYYKTDTHWRQEKILDVANRLASQMGVRLSGEYEIHELDRDFYGVYYGQAALPLAPDRLYYLTGAAIDGCTVYDWQNKKEAAVYDMERAAGKDPYEIYLSGPLSLITIENPKAETEKELVMFRDSFGSSVAPLLIDGYSKITLVDIRYLSPDFLGQFIDFEDCDVLFLYSTLVLNHSETLK